MLKRSLMSLALGFAVLLSGPGVHAQLTGIASLKPNPKFLNCLRLAPTVTPQATIVFGQGNLNDDLEITAYGLKPHLAFDLFTVQKSTIKADGSVDPTVTNFGLAWYQSDLEADVGGKVFAVIRSILVNQIFGFDAGTTPPLPPTNTFHVGFWFNDPNDAKACGFDVTKPTPFNGEHHAGPLAMITTPNPVTGLGPLCLSPNTSTHPATCNP